MAAPTAVLSYGVTTLTLGERPRIKRRADGFDDGRFIFHGGTVASLVPGTAVPGYATMVVTEDDVTDDAGDLEHDVNALGLYDGATSRLIESDAEDVDTGFDVGREVWACTSAAVAAGFLVSRSHSEHSNLKAVTVKVRRGPISALRYADIGFKGIKTGNKPVRYKIGVLTREVNRQNFTVTLPGGDASTAHNWNILLSSPTLQRSYQSTSRPDTTSVGMAITPVGAPATGGFSFSASDDSLTWNWPNGWVYAALECDELYLGGPCFVTEYYIARSRINLG